MHVPGHKVSATRRNVYKRSSKCSRCKGLKRSKCHNKANCTFAYGKKRSFCRRRRSIRHRRH